MIIVVAMELAKKTTKKSGGFARYALSLKEKIVLRYIRVNLKRTKLYVIEISKKYA